MKVVDRKTFLGLPEGTIYHKGKPWYFGNLSIKGESLSHDWFYCDPSWVDANDMGEAASRLEEMLAAGASYPCETNYGRDGCFDEEELFLVYEHADLIWLREQINKAVAMVEAA